MSLKFIKNKIKATERTSKVTRAMEAVSAVKMRKSQERALSGRPFAEAALRILENISHSPDIKQHSYFTHKHGTRDCYIIITADKGLAGNLNSAVLKEAVQHIDSKDKNTLEIVCFGKKAHDFFLRRGYTIAKHYLNINDDISISDMEEVVSFLTTAFVTGVYKNVYVVYQNFVSTFEQRALARHILPIQKDEVRKMIEDILPKQGKYAARQEFASPLNYTTEQEKETLLNSLLRSIVEIMLYHALLESKASEHSARMVAMKNATDKAKEIVHSLTLTFNKERQSVITAEVSEITGGIEAMKN